MALILRQDARIIAAGAGRESAWNLPTGRNVQTRWVEFEPVK
jgi:hypothetical protein